MHPLQSRIISPVWIVAILTLVLVACGGGGGPIGGSSSGVVDGSGGVGGGPGGGGIPGGGGGGAGLQGGVLATFGVGAATFRVWVTDAAAAQQLVDASTGAGPAITSICSRVNVGPGAAQHNAPWSWSLPDPPSFSAICNGCAFAWNTPAAVEAGIVAGPPYNCSIGIGAPPPIDGGGAGTFPMTAMQVVLLGVQDLR